MEFANRMVVVLLVIAVAVAFVGALVRDEHRRDLTMLSGALVVGVLGEAVVGAVVVYSKLNPYVVMVHFLIGMGLVASGIRLTARAGRAPEPATSKVDRQVRNVASRDDGGPRRGPGGGNGDNRGGPARRRRRGEADRRPAGRHGKDPLEHRALARRAHSRGAVADPQERCTARASRQRGQLLLAVMVAQGLIGYTQYFSHEPALFVGVHVAGAVSVWLAMLWFYDGLSHHPAETVSPTDPLLAAAPKPQTSPSWPRERRARRLR